MTETLARRVQAAFTDAFGAIPAVAARAPGRVELLGNHTDHNEGLVLAAAIDRETVVAGRPVEGDSARLRSLNFEGEVVLDPALREKSDAKGWPRYVEGVIWALGEESGSLEAAFELVVGGDIPIGAGLSSSAALQASVALFLLDAGLVPGRSVPRDDAERMALAKTLRRSENEYVGVASGLLDQFSSLFGRAGHALTLDCRTLEYERVPLGDPAPCIVVCDSMTSRELASGMYNVRRAECEAIAKHFCERKPSGNVRSLRDVTLDELLAEWNTLDPVARLRARHVLTENERVRRGAEALKAGDVVTFGRLMTASHISSREDFQNSSPALDAVIEAAESAPGFLGGKLSGAGWAGCTVNLVRADQADAFEESVRTDYARTMGKTPHVYVCRAADGAACLAS